MDHQVGNSPDFVDGYRAGLEEAAKRVDQMLWVYGMNKNIVMQAILGNRL